MPQQTINLGPDHDKSHWPKHIKTITIDRLDLLGYDDANHLYWDGKRIEVSRRLTLSKWQLIGAFVVGFFAIVGAVGSFGQGWAAYNDWACRVNWIAVACPVQP